MKKLIAVFFASTVLAAGADAEGVSNVAVDSELRTSVVVTEAALTPLQTAISNRLRILDKNTAAEQQRSDQIIAWYEKKSFEPIWTKNGQPSAAAQEVVFSLMTAYEEGLISTEYQAEKLFEKLASKTDENVADFEVSLTRAAVAFGQHLYSGRVEPTKINREVKLYPDDISAGRILDRLATSRTPKVTLAALSPNTPRYDRLRSLLLSLRLAHARGGWTIVPEGEVIKDGMTDARVPLLRKRMEESGDLPKGLHEGDVFDGKLVQALRYFQWRMGLNTDGAVGPATLKQLNTPVTTRIEQVELNLERRRWMQGDFGSTHIFVNLADQVLKLVKDEKTIHAAVVQVGQTFHRTPVFTESMEYLDFNPYWNVPYSIATKEYLPKLQRDPYALASQNIRVLRNGKPVDAGSIPWSTYSRGKFPVRLRQDPGPKNALGRVKFMFPNKFNIYIHDTPSKSKFSRASRYFSHGCIRVQNPFQLAQKILGLQGVTKGRIDQIVRSGKRTTVRLKHKIPVHVAYLTAWVNKDGSVHYRRDVYGRDKILKTALAKLN